MIPHAPGLAKERRKRLNTHERCGIQQKSESTNGRRKWIQGLTLLYWICFLGLQLWIFFRMNLDTYDAFNNLRDARTLAGVNAGYEIYRPPMLPVLHAPLQKVLDVFHAGAASRLRAPHLFQCLLSIGCLILVFRYLRLFFSPGWAQLGTILFSLNRLTVHYFGSVMSDMPSALFFILFLQSLDTNPALASMVLGFCLLTRWNMPILLFAVLAYSAVAEVGLLRARLRTATLGILVAIGIFALLYSVVLRLPLMLVLRVLAANGLVAFQGGSTSSTPWTYLKGLYATVGAVSIVFFLIGLRTILQKEGANHRLHAILFLFYLGVMALVAHKDLRYLYCVLPFFYCFVLMGITRIYALIGRFIPQTAHILLTVLLVAVSGAGAMEEWSQFRDPAYTDPILFDTFNAVENNFRPGNKIFWTGSAYSLFPKHYVFIPEDPYYYVYHTPNPGSLEYLLGRQVPSMDDSLLKTVRDGDIMIRSPRRPLIVGIPWDATENRIEVVQRSGTQWKRLALLPK